MVLRLPDSWLNWNLEVLVFGKRGKPEHIWHRRRDLNPGHISGRRALSPMRHPLLPTFPFWYHTLRMRSWAELGFNFHALYIKWTRPSKHCDSRPSHQCGELLATGYGLQKKLIVLSFIQTVSGLKIWSPLQCKVPVFIFCSSGCKEMFCLADILKIGVITDRMIFLRSFLAAARLFLLCKTCVILLFFHCQNKRIWSTLILIIIFIDLYCANINPGKEIFICA